VLNLKDFSGDHEVVVFKVFDDPIVKYTNEKFDV